MLKIDIYINDKRLVNYQEDSNSRVGQCETTSQSDRAVISEALKTVIEMVESKELRISDTFTDMM